jgi:aminomethyltransferase
MKRTALYDVHVAAGARMVPFAGYDMPVQYDGVIAEHTAVRESAGLFDVSHMGQIVFRGKDAAEAVNRLITNDLNRVGTGRAQYTLFCKEDGGILDDAICYRLGDEEVLVVVNAGNLDKMWSWIQKHSTASTAPVNESDQWSLLAIQGPKARQIAERVMPGALELGRFAVGAFTCAGHKVWAATTGYTGEPGYEIFVRNNGAKDVWAALLAAGAPDGLVPCGLGARDSLRLEMKYPLYGNDLDEDTNPIEAGLGWAVRLKVPFIGVDAIRNVKTNGVARKLVGIELSGRGIARPGYALFDLDGKEIGRVTSGTRSPSLKRAICMAWVELDHSEVGSAVQVDIRGRMVEGYVVKTPFYRADEIKE